MIKGEVIIDEWRCNSCGYCVEFCPNKCFERTLDKMSPLGHALPVSVKPEKCTACGTCASMCPRWAITVNRISEEPGNSVLTEKVSGLAIDPPISGCAGCQHPTAGRIIVEAINDLGLGERVSVMESIPCSISSVFGMDFGRKLTYDEIAPDTATVIKRATPEATVIAVMGYWGLSDFSFDIGALMGALIRGEKFTIVMCNMPFYGPKDGRPGPVNAKIEGRMQPATRISTPEGQRLIVGGYPLHMAELVATFEGSVYSARGAMTSMKDYQLTKKYIKTALQKQMEGNGLSFVEVLCTCADPTYSPPVDSLKWVKEKMTQEFPLGEFKIAGG